MEHTPGPWVVAKANDLGIYTNDGSASILQESGDEKHIAFVSCHTNHKRSDGFKVKCDERNANARLIAAAPELLDALEEFYSKSDEHFKNSGWPASFHAGVGMSTVERVRAAIAKAKGELS